METRNFILTLFTEDQMGVLNRIGVIITRRRMKIESLNLAASGVSGIKRITLVINETADAIGKLVLQLEKQLDIIKCYCSAVELSAVKELSIFRFETRVSDELRLLLIEAGARPVSARRPLRGTRPNGSMATMENPDNSLSKFTEPDEESVFELTAGSADTDRLSDGVMHFGLVEIVRTAPVVVLDHEPELLYSLLAFSESEPAT